jgi:hypothetical protein
MPEGMEIDHKSTLNGVISGYAEQVLVCTGRDDWTSRIEDECDGDNLAADLKELFGRGGRFSDVSVSLIILIPTDCYMEFSSQTEQIRYLYNYMSTNK